MKKILLAVVALIIVFLAGNFVQKVKAQNQPSQVRLLETIPYPTEKPNLIVYCDAPRGNIVYLAVGPVGGYGLQANTITAVHEPDICK